MLPATSLLPLALAATALAVGENHDFEAAPLIPVPSTSLWWGDFDGDGRQDAYVVQPDGSAKLLSNLGEGRFQDVTERVGLSDAKGAHMAAWGDANGDGRLDLFLPAWRGKSRLFVQTGEGTFVEETEAADLPAYAEPIDAKWIDVDSDGHFDLWLTTLYDDLVYRNDGAGRFGKIDLGLEPRHSDVDGSARPENIDAARALRGLDPIGAGGPDTNGPGAPGNLDFQAVCAIGIQDQSNPSACMSASSVPTLGMLYPISQELFVDDATGNVGLGTTSPGFALEVLGTIRASGDFRGGRAVLGADPPLAVSGSSVVTNLNADLLDGLHASAFATVPVDGGEIADGTITSVDVADDSLSGADIGAGAIASSELADAAVLDAHVDAAAAIAGTKIAPDFGAQTVLTLGTASVGTAFPNSQLHVNGATGVDPLRVQVSGSTRLFVEQTTGDIGVGGFFDPVRPLHVNGQIFAQNTASGGRAIEGYASNTGSSAQYGVLGFSAGTGSNGAALYGAAVAPSGSAKGVWGTSFSPSGIAVYGTASSGSSANWGVFGRSASTAGRGVRGEADATSGTNYGVQGRTHSSSGYGVISFGASGSTGQKNFIQPHPEDASKEIRFISLEGNESGTYFRGKTWTVGGAAIIEVPEEFRLVSTAHDMTVQTTVIGAPAQVWVESYDLNRIVVRSTVDVELHYIVNSIRRGFTEPRIVADNTSYVPEVSGVEAFTELPDDLRRILVANGILNADFTPNEATALQMGWKLMTREEAAAMVAPGPQPTPVSPLLSEE